MSAILEAILKTLPLNWQMQQLYIGLNWTISVVQNRAGERRAGLAATPSLEQLGRQSRFQPGNNQVSQEDALVLAGLAQATEPVATAIGLATLNALLEPDSARLEEIDAGDWLLEQGRNQKIALVGRFPFAEELKPVVSQLWVLELNPQPGEYASAEAKFILPQADIVAITGSTLVNHSLEGLLALTDSKSKVILLGPTTPLTPLLFGFGVDLVSGVQVVDIESTLASIKEGVSFRKMRGVRRLSLQKS